MQIIKHPLTQIIIIQILLTIILISFFINKSLIFTPVIIFKLEKDILSNLIGDMLQDTQFRIHHTLDSKRINFLRTCNRNTTICSRNSGFIKFQSKIIHILKIICTNHISINLVFLINKENSGKKIITDYLGKFRKGIDGNPIFIHIAIYRQTVCHSFDTIVIKLQFSHTGYILRTPTTCLKSIQLVHGSITILIITALIHITLRQIHLRNHHISQNLGIRKSFSRLGNDVNNRTRARTAA